MNNLGEIREAKRAWLIDGLCVVHLASKCEPEEVLDAYDRTPPFVGPFRAESERKGLFARKVNLSGDKIEVIAACLNRVEERPERVVVDAYEDFSEEEKMHLAVMAHSFGFKLILPKY